MDRNDIATPVIVQEDKFKMLRKYHRELRPVTRIGKHINVKKRYSHDSTSSSSESEDYFQQIGFGEALGKCLDIITEWRRTQRDNPKASLGTRTALAVLDLASVLKEWCTEFYNLVTGLMPDITKLSDRVCAFFAYLFKGFLNCARKTGTFFEKFYTMIRSVFKNDLPSDKEDDDKTPETTTTTEVPDPDDKGKEKAKDEDDIFAQAGDDDEFSFCWSFTEGPRKLFSKIIECVACIIKTVFPEKFSMKGVANWCKDIKAYFDLYAALERINPVRIFRKLVNYFYRWYTGEDYYDEFKIKRKVNETFTELEEMLNDAEKDNIVDSLKAHKITVLLKIIVDNFVTYSQLFPNETTTYKSRMDFLGERAARFQATCAGIQTRIAPVTICLFGKAGTGKTETQKRLAKDLPQVLQLYFQRFGLDPNSRAFMLWKSHTVMPVVRNSNCTQEPLEFDAEGYNNQMFHFFNELYTSTSTEINAKWATVLMKYADDQPCQLNAATLKGKIGIYYDTPFIFCTGNSTSHTPPVKDPDAYFRRIDLDLEVTRDFKSKDFFGGIRYSLTKKCKDIMGGKFPRNDAFAALNMSTSASLTYDELLRVVATIYIRRITQDPAARATAMANIDHWRPVHHESFQEGLFWKTRKETIVLKTENYGYCMNYRHQDTSRVSPFLVNVNQCRRAGRVWILDAISEQLILYQVHECVTHTGKDMVGRNEAIFRLPTCVTRNNQSMVGVQAELFLTREQFESLEKAHQELCRSATITDWIGLFVIDVYNGEKLDWIEYAIFGLVTGSVRIYCDGIHFPFSATHRHPKSSKNVRVMRVKDDLTFNQYIGQEFLPKSSSSSSSEEIPPQMFTPPESDDEAPDVQAQAGQEIDWLAYGRAVYNSYQVCFTTRSMYLTAASLSSFNGVSPKDFGVTYELPNTDRFSIYSKLRAWISPFAAMADEEKVEKPSLYIRNMKIYALAMLKLKEKCVLAQPSCVKNRRPWVDRNADRELLARVILSWPETQRRRVKAYDVNDLYPSSESDVNRARIARRDFNQYHRRRVNNNKKRHRRWIANKNAKRISMRQANVSMGPRIKKGQKDKFDREYDYQDERYDTYSEVEQYDIDRYNLRREMQDFYAQAGALPLLRNKVPICPINWPKKKQYCRMAGNYHNAFWFLKPFFACPEDMSLRMQGNDINLQSFYTGLDMKEVSKRTKYKFSDDQLAMIPPNAHWWGTYVACYYIWYTDTMGRTLRKKDVERIVAQTSHFYFVSCGMTNPDKGQGYYAGKGVKYHNDMHAALFDYKDFYDVFLKKFMPPGSEKLIPLNEILTGAKIFSGIVVVIEGAALAYLATKVVFPLLYSTITALATFAGFEMDYRKVFIDAPTSLVRELNEYCTTTGIVFEQSGENDKAAPKVRAPVNLAQQHHMKYVQQGASCDSLVAKVQANMYWVPGTGGVRLGYVTFIRGKIAIMNKHVYEMVMAKSDDYVDLMALKPPTGQRVRFRCPKNGIRVIKTNEDVIELCFNDVRNHSDLRSRIATTEEVIKNKYVRGAMIITADGIEATADPIMHYQLYQRPQKVKDNDGNFAFELSSCAHYVWSGAKPSACGSIGICELNGNYKLTFIHAAGNSSTNSGVGAFIGDLSFDEDDTYMQQSGCLMSYDYEREGLCSVTDNAVITPYRTRATGKTILTPTPFYEHEPELAPKVPAKLDTTAYRKALEKEALTENECYTRAIVSWIYQNYFMLIISKISAVPLRELMCCRMLTFEEALYGIPGFLDAFDFSTSKGLTLRMLDIDKRDLRDPNHPSVAKLKDYVMNRVDRFLEGKFDFQINCDCLKDELRDHERVRLGKTRIFNVTDFVDNILIKMFIGDLAGRLGFWFSLTPSECGINPTGGYWKHIYDRFKRFASMVFGDISGWDHTAPIGNEFIVWKFFSLCYAPKLAQCAMWTYQGARQALRFNNGFARQNNRGNSSGNWATTFFNSMDNIIEHTTICIKLALDNGDDPELAVRNLELAIYSDDNLSASDFPWWTTKNVADGFKELYGITFTGTDKGEIDTETIKTIDDADFLSRSFRYEDGRVFAPLSRDSLLAQLFFVRMTKKNADHAFILDQLTINLDNVARELFEYPESEAKAISKEIQRIITDYSIPVVFVPLDYSNRDYKSNYA